ncbi:MAG: two-component system, OmpR family, sensor kinase, partial [Solirubrobacteraceae bacterium]|nr:two-component system, OmpR family, sensor kinase [Solirubrobacteraceae bacterium]
VCALGEQHRRRRRCASLIARASHELRGPIAAARLGLHGLAREGAAARVAAIDLELRRAGLALDDLAAASRGRRLPLRRPEPIDLAELLAEAADGWETLAAHRGAALTVESASGRGWVRGDRLRLAQACGNLVGNALEHGGGAVTVRVRTGGGEACVEVTDSGPGLPAPVGDLVAAARGRRTRRGHGLAIAAAIAREHGGRLTAAPSPAGARLVLAIPAAGAAARGRTLRSRLRANAPARERRRR